jgi:hypothetical protein
MDDANDVFPHEHRRELRGYYVLCSWLNHDDSRSVNTLDMYVGQPGQGSVKHYLIDFGSTLGSGSVSAQKIRPGNEYMWEAKPTFASMLSLGIWLRPWVSVRYPDMPEVGRFESEFFQANSWKPEYPNPAFANMDVEDAFWATRLMMMFTDSDIRAIVRVGSFTDRKAEEYIAQTLIKRRDKIGNYWLRQVSSLDGFRVADGILLFEDLLVKYGFEKEIQERRVQFASFNNETGERSDIGSASTTREGRIPLPSTFMTAPDNAFFMVTLAANERSADVFLKKDQGTLKVVGIQRK